MRSKKGFTLVELMVVVLIVGILAAVALPLMSGKIASAKWSEAAAAAGTIATAIRAYAAEMGVNGDYTATGIATAMSVANTQTLLGISAADLTGTYFTPAMYVISGASYSAANGVSFTITVTNANIDGGPKSMIVANNATTKVFGK